MEYKFFVYLKKENKEQIKQLSIDKIQKLLKKIMKDKREKKLPNNYNIFTKMYIRELKKKGEIKEKFLLHSSQYWKSLNDVQREIMINKYKKKYYFIFHFDEMYKDFYKKDCEIKNKHEKKKIFDELYEMNEKNKIKHTITTYIDLNK